LYLLRYQQVVGDWLSLPALTGCIQSAGSPAPPSASAAPTLPTAHWEQPSASIVSQWEYDAGLNLPSKPMHTQNSIDGSPITDTEFSLAFTIDAGLYSAGNEILDFRVDFQPSDATSAREGAGLGTGALPEFNVNGLGATTSLRLVSEGVTPTLNLPALGRGSTVTFDILSLADTQYGGTTTISFTNSTMLSSFKILVYLQIMGDNGVAGLTLTHTFNPQDEWPDAPYILGPTTHIPQVTMKLKDWTSQLQGVDPSLTEYTGIFNWDAGIASVPIKRADESAVRHKHNYVPPGGVGNPCEPLLLGYHLALGWDFGTASDSTHYATIPAIKPDGNGNLNSIEELKITITHTSDPAETHNLPKWGNAWGEGEPPLIFNAFEMTGETYGAPFNYMLANNTTSVPVASQLYLHEMVGINEDDGILNFNGPLNSSSNTATFTFTGWLVDSYNQNVQLASMGTPIQLSTTFIAEPGC